MEKEKNQNQVIENLSKELDTLKKELEIAQSKRLGFIKWMRNYLFGYDVKDLSKKNNRKNALNKTILGTLIGLGIGVPVTFYILNYAEGNYKFIIYSILIAIFSLGLFLLIFVLAKKSILKNTFEVEDASYKSIANNIFSGIQELIPEKFENLKTSSNYFKEASKEMAAYISYSRTRNTLLGLFIALIAGYAGYLGTMLLIKQNKLIVDQNKLIIEQNQLSEAGRRSSLIFMMSNIMDKVDDELKNDYLKDKQRNLSPELIGRIGSLSQALKPYKYLENDNLILTPLSPERGQLLMALINSNLDEKTYDAIFSNSNFEYSDLKKVRIIDVSLERINLKNSDLSDAFIQNVNLRNANLNNVRLKETFFNHVDFSYSNLSEIVFERTNLCGIKFYFTNLSYSVFTNQIFSLQSTGVTNVDTFEVKIIKDNPNIFNEVYNCQPTEITYSIFHRAKLKHSHFQLDLIGCSFKDADLSGSSLVHVKRLDSIDFRGANLEDVAIDADTNWLNNLDNFNVIGSEELKSLYTIKLVRNYSENGISYSEYGKIRRKTDANRVGNGEPK